jgi:predicted AlkP superfamily pyrophosphatase or phosphodiesterase
MKFAPGLVALLLLLGIGPATAVAARAAARAVAPVTILVSIDGFRPDYLERGLTPNLQRLSAGGVHAAMRPAFPSLTFPNHYTLVTGLSPDRHGVVGNTMTDPRRPDVRFTLSDTKQSLDPFWWDGAEPLWVTAEKQGVRTATMFWPGSEVAIHGQRPADWWRFDAAATNHQRVDAVLDWLRRPVATRPRFVTLYFDSLDHEAHGHGPDSTEANAAMAEIDTRIGELTAGLAGLGVAADLIIVSDHGMVATGPERVIRLDQLVELKSVTVVGDGAASGIYPAAGATAAVEAVLLAPQPHMQCWRKSDIPARFDYGRNLRVAPLYCLAQVGWSITTSDRAPLLGNHGYDNAAPEMTALFIANGPSFRAAKALPSFPNVDVYPLLARLAGVAPLANEGDATIFAPVLRLGR